MKIQSASQGIAGTDRSRVHPVRRLTLIGGPRDYETSGEQRNRTTKRPERLVRNTLTADGNQRTA